jgi:hypothetical protein
MANVPNPYQIKNKLIELGFLEDKNGSTYIKNNLQNEFKKVQ